MGFAQCEKHCASVDVLLHIKRHSCVHQIFLCVKLCFRSRSSVSDSHLRCAHCIGNDFAAVARFSSFSSIARDCVFTRSYNEILVLFSSPTSIMPLAFCFNWQSHAR